MSKSKRSRLDKLVRYGKATDEQKEKAHRLARERDRKNGRKQKTFFVEEAA